MQQTGLLDLLPFLARTQIAYFSMEIALDPAIHTYSGGLGVLAGDSARSCADLELPVVFVAQASKSGYLRQEIDSSGRQLELPDSWNPADRCTQLRTRVAILIGSRPVWIQPWLYLVTGRTGYQVPVILLDTDVVDNHPEDRRITAVLYDSDEQCRLKQRIVLGVGGLRMLEALHFYRLRSLHMNEGHAALLGIDLLRRQPRPADQVRPGELAYDVRPVRQACVFTTHTPVAAGHDRFDYGIAHQLLGHYMELPQLQLIAGHGELNLSEIGVRLSGFVNGVARRHAETTRRMFPGHRIHAITNGVHLPSWTHPAVAELFDRHVPDWRAVPEDLARVEQIPDAQLWRARQHARGDLIDLIAARTGVRFDPEHPTIGFARRMTAYKRAEFLFSDIERLLAIAGRHPFQLVLAGKAHPRDFQGKDIIARLGELAATLGDRLRIAFLPGYDMALGRAIVAGADVWLNTPEPPMEASGTSGMKAALNGGLNLSVLDGWWIEACMHGTTGWAIGGDYQSGAVPEADDLYRVLETEVLPCWYERRPRWLAMMKQSMSRIPPVFNTDRMMRRYAAEAYLR